MFTTRKEWRRWFSGAYNRTVVVREVLTRRLSEYAEGFPYMYRPDHEELRDTGKVKKPTRGTRDAFSGVCHDLRMNHAQTDKVRKALFS